MVALALSDKNMLRRMWVIFGATVAQMAIVVAVVWIVYQTYAWWAYLLWFLLVLVLSICWCLFPLQAMWRKMLWPVSAAMLVGSIILGGSAMLMLPISVFLSIYSVLMACMTASLMQTMMSFQRNQQKPEALRDDMFHQVRNLAQPLVMVVPMLYAGMLQGGVPAFDGLLVTLLLIAASFVANILAGFVALGMIMKKNKA
jgi:putative flippase GtrA